MFLKQYNPIPGIPVYPGMTFSCCNVTENPKIKENEKDSLTDEQISSLEIACGNTSGAKAASEQVFNLLDELEKELEDNSGNANSKVMRTIEAIKYASCSAANMNAEAKYVLEELLKTQNITTE